MVSQEGVGFKRRRLRALAFRSDNLSAKVAAGAPNGLVKYAEMLKNHEPNTLREFDNSVNNQSQTTY